MINAVSSRPVFRICVLYVDEDISVQRQLARGRMIREHNQEVKKTGQGVLWEERVTDNDETVSETKDKIGLQLMTCYFIGDSQSICHLQKELWFPSQVVKDVSLSYVIRIWMKMCVTLPCDRKKLICG